MPATVILNPYSNRWKAGERVPEIESALRQAGIEFQMKLTERPAHAIELAREAIQSGNTPVIAAGGDGGISEVINGVMEGTPPDQRPAGPVGFIPLGTANDLTDMLGLPRGIEEAVEVIKNGKTRNIDVGIVNGRYFDNNSAIGLEPVVSLYNVRLTWMKGMIRYLTAAVLAILKRPSWDAHFKWDDGEYEGSITLVSVGNSRRTGGFFMTPNAVLDDGLLDFIFAPKLGRLKLLTLLPKALSGTHVNDPVVQEHRATRLAIRTNPPTPIQADGELFGEDTREVVYEVVPAGLQVFTP